MFSSGLANGQPIGTATISAPSGRGSTARVAPYPLTPSAATGGTFTAGNYSITYNTGNLTVNAAALSITASAQSKTYGSTVPTGAGSSLFTSSGLQNSETIASVTIAIANSGAVSTATVANSPYTITPSAATGGTINVANYSITYNTGLLTVNKLALTVTSPAANNKVY